MLDGTVHPDYADVASSLIRQIPTDQNAGSAVCVYHHGQCVVDVWGGIKDSEGRPWVADTTAPSFSTTKGVMSTLIHILVDQGKARYDDTIASHWPEFACRGKENITIRQALCHEAGLYRVTEMIRKPDEMLDWGHMKLKRSLAGRCRRYLPRSWSIPSNSMACSSACRTTSCIAGRS
jgi:CubicO group peptidase (beta-lactamase class C family)